MVDGMASNRCFSLQGKLLTAASCYIWIRLLVATCAWYAFAQVLFPRIEELTGVCPVSAHLTRQSCYQAGFRWTGLDISGHCFLLTFSSLVITEELGNIHRQFRVRESLLCSATTGLLQVLVLVWEGMMLATSLYFHTEIEKVLGVLCAILPWAVLYKLVPTLTTHVDRASNKIKLK